jgi:sugar/nucleoside kinase (ribokinase family)
VVTLNFSRTPSRSGSGVDLCIIGNLTIDVIMRGIDELPGWGHEALSSARTESVAGQAGGLAFAGVALGILTDVVADVGEDDAGARIRRELAAAGVGVEAISVVLGGITPLTVAVVRTDGERAFISDLGRLRIVDIESTARQQPQIFDASVVALVGTSNLTGIDLNTAARVLARARRAGALTVFDPGWDADGWTEKSVHDIRAVLVETDVFLPNLDEARALTGRSELSEVFGSFSSSFSGVVIVKDGERGSYAVFDGGAILAEAIPTQVDNAVGAGDVFDAGVIAGYLRGRDVVASMALGTAAASLYVARRQDRFPSFGEVDALAQRVNTSMVEERS